MNNNHQDHCAVCGLRVEDTRYAVKYGNMRYYLCSNQCHGSFADHPGLYSHYPTINSAEVTKNRTLRFTEALDELTVHKVNNKLRELEGVKEWQINGSAIRIRYDLRQSNLGKVEAALRQSGVRFAHGWWQRVMHACLLNTEETELENLRAPAGACCNRPPPGA